MPGRLARSLAAAALGLAGLIAGPALRADGAEAEAEFDRLYKEAMDNPAKADFGRLRAAFAATGRYDPLTAGAIDRKPAERAVEKGDAEAARAAVEALIARHPVDIDARAFASTVCEKLGDKEQARKHEKVMAGLIGAILGTGDGTTPQKAWPVLSVREEYLILDSIGLKKGVASTQRIDGHDFDVHKFLNKQTGQVVTIYFNIDLPRRAQRRQSGAAAPGPER